MKISLKKSGLFPLILLLLTLSCRKEVRVSHPPVPIPPAKELPKLGYSIQVGAFSLVGNAVRLTGILNRNELDAYYFVHESGLYKVRFGDFASKDEARQKAENLMKAGVFTEYFIVNPGDYTVGKRRKHGAEYLRSELVETAMSFIGLPYAWGGTSPERGFDCSGLTMAVYKLNGLNLPRSSREQWETGNPVRRSKLMKGDLVFFATSEKGKISHVGIYTGDDSFIHAPGKNKKIRKESFLSRYFQMRFIGARTFLD